MKNKIPEGKDPDYPFLFRIARSLHALLTGYRGEYFLYSQLVKFNKLDRAGRFTFFDGEIYIPLQVPETLYIRDFSLFQGLREVNFAHQLNRMFDEFVLLDCGAYFAQVSMRIARLCPGVSNIVLLDPNADNCIYARANLALTGKPFSVINAAVSDFTGKARLVFPEGVKVPDSAFIQQSEEGDIDVLRLDDLEQSHQLALAGKNLAIKLDVEGQELAAVRGAEQLIKAAGGVCYFVELHPAVLKRAGETAESLLRSITDLRPTVWHVADQPELTLSLDRPIFEQIGEEKICDVIGVAT